MIFPLRYVFVFFYLSAIVVGFDDLLTCVPYDHPTPHPPALWTCLQPWQASTQVSRLSPASSSSSTVRRPPREWWDTPCRRVRLTVFLYQAHSDVKWPVVFFFFIPLLLPVVFLHCTTLTFIILAEPMPLYFSYRYYFTVLTFGFYLFPFIHFCKRKKENINSNQSLYAGILLLYFYIFFFSYSLKTQNVAQCELI